MKKMFICSNNRWKNKEFIMTDTKKVLETLIRIAQKQQKVINKMAQDLTPQTLEPVKTQKTPSKVLFDALDPAIKANVQHIEEHDNDMTVFFKDGQKTQANYGAVLATLQKLTSQNIIQKQYNLKAA